MKISQIESLLELVTLAFDPLAVLVTTLQLRKPLLQFIDGFLEFFQRFFLLGRFVLLLHRSKLALYFRQKLLCSVFEHGMLEASCVVVMLDFMEIVHVQLANKGCEVAVLKVFRQDSV